MIAKMKLSELACHNFSKRYKTWEHVCICNDSFLSGHREGVSIVLKEAEKVLDESMMNFLRNLVDSTLNKTVDVEFKDGSHQLVFKCD